MKPYLLLCSLILAGCESNDQPKETETITLESHQVLSRDFMGVQQLCPATKVASSAQLQAYCLSIDGFIYQWGYTVELLMRREKISNPPQDGANERLIVVSQTIKKEDPVGTIYALIGVELEGLVFYQENNRYFLKGEQVSCAETVNCSLLSAMNNSAAIVDITLAYQGQGQIQLAAWQ